MPKDNLPLINREISWLRFNDRVLQEAADSNVPVIERIRFLGIFSNNRDEFFRVRVATLKRMESASKKALKLIDEDLEELLSEIQRMVIAEQHKSEKIYRSILKELESEKIFIINENQLLPEHIPFIKDYFISNVLPSLAPIMLDSAPKFPYLKDKSIYFTIKMTKWGKEEKIKYALIEISSDTTPRFIVLPEIQNKKYVIFLDDVIRYCLDDIFSIFDYDDIEAYTIKLTRDAELNIDNDVSKALLDKLSNELKNRKKGAPVRLVYDSEIPKDMLNLLMKKINVLKEDNLIPGGRYHNFKDFMQFPNVGVSALRYKNIIPLHDKDLDIHKSSFKILREKDILLTFPYQSYHHIIDLLREASIDPKVTAIDITLYRLASNSNIVNALINAAKNGKSVTAIVELKARFDEEANIFWAKKLEEEGAKVIYGATGLKVHSKLFIIYRKEKDQINKYAHIGTGNFNENTAKLYSDFSLLTSSKKITNELKKLFEFYLDNKKKATFKHLLVSPFTMRRGLTTLIENEIKNAKTKKPAYIDLKMNSLVDEAMIKKLYAASNAGVKIRLIIRGICCIVPQLGGSSTNIKAISIVDKFLEHGRLFIFCNNEKSLTFISSGDWMTRNIDHRSEVAVPIYDKDIQKELKEIFEIQWSDNTKARILNSKQDNHYVSCDKKVKVLHRNQFINT